MKKSSNVAVYIAIALVLLLIYFITRSSTGPKFDWNSSYAKNSKQPYGTDLLYTLLQKTNHVNVLFNENYSQLDSVRGESNFLYLSTSFDVNEEQCQKLLNYVKRGNTVVIATDDAPLEILRQFLPTTDTIRGYSLIRDSITTINFDARVAKLKDTITVHYQKFKDTVGYSWGLYPKHYFYDTLVTYGFKSFASFPDSNVTAFSINHGKGKFLIHANPILFSNFYFVKKSGYVHTNNMLQFFNKGPVYWNDYDFSQEENHSGGNNPLRFLFTHRSLQWGWYLFLIAILFYILFRSKREQRIIPLLPQNKNTAIEYIKTAGLLYFKSSGHHHIAKEMKLLFLSDVRSKYNLPTDLPELELIEKLAIRSGIEKESISKIFSQFKYAMTANIVGNDDLISLHALIENYHKTKK